MRGPGMELTEVWNRVREGGGEVRGFQVGPLRVWMTEREGDLWLRMDRRLEEESAGVRWLEEGPEGEGDWRRAGAWEDLGAMELRPAFPDRPVVVRPEFTYSLLPGERIQFYVGVPIVVTLRRGSEPAFFQEQVSPLSNTWFGTPTEGELCYALRTQARRKGETLDFGDWRVVCPVRVRNQSKEILTLQRLCLRLQYLSIFHHAARGLWSNESSVVFRGGDSWSRVAYARKAPAELEEATRWVEGVEDPQGTFLQRALTQGKGFFQ